MPTYFTTKISKNTKNFKNPRSASSRLSSEPASLPLTRRSSPLGHEVAEPGNAGGSADTKAE